MEMVYNSNFFELTHTNTYKSVGEYRYPKRGRLSSLVSSFHYFFKIFYVIFKYVYVYIDKCNLNII